MKIYLSAREALNQMCSLSPERIFLYGIRRFLSGIGIILLIPIIVFPIFQIRGLSQIRLSEVNDWFLAILFVLIVLACLGGGLFFITDGTFSLLKKFVKYSKDGNIYFRNDGFINRPSVFDRYFGERVIPVDNSGDLNYFDGYIFLNGFIVKETFYWPSTGYYTTTSYNHNSKKNIVSTHSYTLHVTSVAGEWCGIPLKAFISSKNRTLAINLASFKKNTALYLMGSLERDEFNVKDYGKALR